MSVCCCTLRGQWSWWWAPTIFHSLLVHPTFFWSQEKFRDFALDLFTIILLIFILYINIIYAVTTANRKSKKSSTLRCFTTNYECPPQGKAKVAVGKKKVFPLYITFGGGTPDPTKSRTKVLFNPLATTFRSRGWNIILVFNHSASVCCGCAT